jgi:hypothetical protein
MRMASTPTVVDLTAASSASSQPFAWTPLAVKPERQLAARRQETRTLSQRLERLKSAVGELPRVASVGA